MAKVSKWAENVFEGCEHECEHLWQKGKQSGEDW